MSRCYLSALIFAGLMIGFAVLARVGLADRQAVEIMLLVLPIIAATQIYRGRASCVREA